MWVSVGMVMLGGLGWLSKTHQPSPVELLVGVAAGISRSNDAIVTGDKVSEVGFTWQTLGH